MRGHGEEGASENSSPEGVGRCEIQGEIEHVELARGRGHGVNHRPSPLHVRSECEERHDSAADVDRHLHHVGPNDGRHSAFEGVEQR